VFGRRAGKHAASYVDETKLVPLPPEPEYRARAEIDALITREKGEKIADIRAELQREMMDKASVFRTNEGMQQMESKLGELRERYNNAVIQDKGKIFNMDLLEALELGSLLDCSEAILAGAIARTESRGAHSRDDYPDRDDDEWLAHTMAYKTSGGVELKKKPVVITRFEPQERKY
ncbi:MAG: succinate dehydrogenase/fumarate reductase flavoprotein subunit, partial [Chloroflexota bacterium]